MADAPCCMNKELGHADCGCRAGATPDLIPRADAELAVAEAIRRAADIFTERAKQERSHDYAELGNIARSDVRAKAHEADAAAILSLAPAEALAEVQRLREESAERHALHLEQARITSEWIAERDAALARVEKLRQQITEATDPDFLFGAMDNVNDMDATLDQFAAAASRAIRAALDEDARHG